MIQGDEKLREPCLNCSTELIGDYCHSCGQAATVHRYKIGTLAGDAYRELRKIDLTTTLSTAWELLIRPGVFVREYLAGKRVGYINPIKFFFYAFVADTAIRSGLLYLTGDKSFSNIMFSDGWFQVTDLIATVFWGFLWGLFYRSSELNVAECAVAALLFQAEVNFLTSALLILTLPVELLEDGSHSISKTVEGIVTVGYSYFFAFQLFSGHKLWIFLKQTVLLCIFAILIFFLVILKIIERAALPPAVAN